MPSATASPRNTQVRRVLTGILVANAVVVAIKIAVGLGTQSLAVLGDAIHSSVDAMNNIFGIAMIRVAAKAPDAEHPYGHAKFETLGALLMVVLLSVSIFELVRGAVVRLIEGTAPSTIGSPALILLTLTLGVNIVVVALETRAGRRLNSELLLADAVHTRVDVLVTLAVLGGLVLARAGQVWADPVLAIVVALFVTRAGYQIVARSIPTLVDQRAFHAETIRQEAMAVPDVRAAYAIRSRVAGPLRFAEITIGVDGAADVATAHQIADAVEDRLRKQLSLHEVVVHVEPC